MEIHKQLIANAEEKADRMRLALEKIAWMDEFMDAEGAKAMVKIAREAIRNDVAEAEQLIVPHNWVGK